jgi:hypothetical protein
VSNDLVNFLSTASASAFALGLMALLPHSGAGQFLESLLSS